MKIGRWPILVVVISFAIAVIYRYGPSRDKPKWRWVSPGCILATVLWLAASLLFSWYAENFGSYNKTYGSLGAAIGFMTWLWISTIVILLGAKLNAELEHQTMKDTTEGHPTATRSKKFSRRRFGGCCVNCTEIATVAAADRHDSILGHEGKICEGSKPR